MASALAALVALAMPDEGGRVGIPAGDGVIEPGDQLVLGLGMVAVESAANDDPLDCEPTRPAQRLSRRPLAIPVATS